MVDNLDLQVRPVTPQRWDDLEKLFGPRGACGGCWCMWWRVPRSDWPAMKGEPNRQFLKGIIESGDVPGLLAYIDGEPAGWCSIAPREAFPVLDRSRILKRVDDQPVWSVVCFFVAKPFRRKGLTVKMLESAVDYARQQSATIIEGYPVEPKRESVPEVFVFTGLKAAFEKAGFVEVARRSETRPIMRYRIEVHQ